MNKIKYLAIALLAIGLTACGGNSMKPVSTKINGPLGKFFEVVDKEYTMNDKEISVEFKRIADGGPTTANWNSRPTFTVDLIDDGGNTIESVSTDVVWTEDQLETVFALGVDETATITFTFAKTGGKQLKVSSKWNENAESNGNSSNASASSSDDSDDNSSSTDWDALLDDYEEYTDAYIRLYKKAQNGDLDALSDYADMLEKAESVYEKMEDAGDMSTAQMNRMNKIHQKMIKAM